MISFSAQETNILVVDDVADNLKILSRTLSQEGYRVRCAAAFVQARSELGSLSPVTPSVCPVCYFVHRFFPCQGCSWVPVLGLGDRGVVRDDIRLSFP